VLSDEQFVAGLDAYVTPLIGPGRVNSLAQQLLKLTCPGVPDVYQGTELWDLSLVDPDNRRPVDYELRRQLLASKATPPDAWRDHADSGLPKVLLTHRTLQLRQRLPDAFGPDSSYEPLDVRGDRAVAFARLGRGGAVITVVPRLVLRAAPTEVRLPAGEWRSELTGSQVDGGWVSTAALFADFPVALLSQAGTA